MRHPTTATWQFPPDDRSPLPVPLERTNLRELLARPGRHEHHLMVVANIGVCQIEAVTASEPLFFAHRNISDEYALPLPTGDPMLDAFPFRTFVSDFETNQDLARYKHRAGQLVLHPHGYLHWPGRLRPPYAPFEMAPGMRRCGVTAVFCASEPTPPAPDRPLFVSLGHEVDTKQYSATAVPLLLAELLAEADRTVAEVGDTHIDLRVRPDHIAPTRGGYALVLAASGLEAFATDLIYIPAGASLDGAGIERALVIASSSADPEPPPPSWSQVPDPPFAVFEAQAAGDLPVRINELEVTAVSDTEVAVRVGDSEPVSTPRYWLARMLFRIALHDYRLGYVSTYDGFFYSDDDGYRLGVRGVGSISLTRPELEAAVELLYRAVAPAGYTERLT